MAQSMRIGVLIGTDGGNETLDEVIGTAREVEALGLDDVWMANIFGLDAISVLALIGRETTRIRLGTAVTPTYPRHPTAIAQQALTAAAASGGRFTLGIGLSHQVVIENMLGMSYHRPARHMREYLSVLMPLARGEAVTFQGEQYKVNGIALDVPGGAPMPVLIAALGPAMLKLAGSMADGTITWMVGPDTMESHIVASLHAAAARAGRPEPRVVGGYPVVLTGNVEAAREKINERLAIYGQLPSYRAMLDREGAASPADVALVGDEAELRAALSRLEGMGVTDFSAAIADVEEGARTRTLEFLASLK